MLHLRCAYERLQTAVEAMAQAAQSMRAAQQEAEQAAERLTLVAAQPAFACLTLQQVAVMLRTISSQHTEQLQVRGNGRLRLNVGMCV